MSPLAASAIGMADPGTDTQVVELVVDTSVPATFFICVCVVPLDAVRAAAVAANAPTAMIAVRRW